MNIADRILEGLGHQLDLVDVLGAPAPASPTDTTGIVRASKHRRPAAAVKESDRYFTTSEIHERALQQWGEIDLDPAWDPSPQCIVKAKRCYDIRKGEDGTLLPWPAGSRVWLNPPFSDPEPWLRRAVMHTSDGGEGEVLALVGAGTGTKAWVSFVWPHAIACMLAPRPTFMKVGAAKPTYHPSECAVLYYGANRKRFAKIWADRGPIVGLLRRP